MTVKPSVVLSLSLLVSSCLLPLSLSRWIVSHLPGFHGPLPFYLETGYVVVDEDKDAQLFYYFVKSERNPQDDPLLLWLTGGPGCSGFSGMTTEIGPISFDKVEYDGSVPTLILNSYSWTKFSNVIFLDSPVGTGFSFSRSTEDYPVGDVISSKQAYKFLRKWLVDHPEFLSNPIYVSGDSYSGKVIPIVAHLISKGIELEHDPIINLKGYLVGNPIVGGDTVDMSQMLASYGFGLIPKELYKSVKMNCKGESYINPSNAICARDLKTYFYLLSEISELHVLEFACQDDTIMLPHKTEGKRVLHEDHISINPPDIRCNCYTHYLCYMWGNFAISRRALHVQEGTIGEWKRCNTRLPYEKIPSSIGFYLNLTNKGYRGLIYSGDHDLVVPHLSTQEWIRSFNLPIVDGWRPWWVDNQVAGYTTTYVNNLTFATVKGGGHTAPEYQPKECQALVESWLSYKPL